MPQVVPLKKVAKAMLYGIKLAYGNRLQDSKREVLYELLDDMAVALTAYAIENDNTRIAEYAGVLGDLSNEINIPIPKKKKRKQ